MRKLNIVKHGKTAKINLRIQLKLSKIPAAIVAEIDKLFLKFIWKCTGPTLGKTVFKKKEKFGRHNY